MRVVLILGLAAALTACGGDDPDPGAGRTRIVVTTSILGDVVAQVVGGSADVEVVMPIGADPHEFAPSARQVEAMAAADLLVVNGAGFEERLDDAIERAEDGGAEVFAFTDHVDLLDGDPHFWTDPTRMAAAVEALVTRLAALGIDERADAYVEDLRALDAEIESILATLPAERRVLVTNHEVLGSFADRYGFEVIGAVIPSPTTGAAPSAADVEALADLIEAERVPAIFGETTSSASVAEALAESVGDIEVVRLFTESLGEPGSGADTYLDMLRTDAELIAAALA